ncbi:hypothetical protein BGZ95_001066 [Linnemannia exigua]|uniref:Uncharacterized protein n=1 Tax=Linnemannia exigua TaxID=604196 RepID=A0AAD4H304_9FUNG|nr:hypothetical protein BGZ95_001066 [Linnemannia exigua]
MFPVGFYVSFVVGVGLRMILNDLRKRDNEIQHQKELLLRLEKEMPPLPATTTTTKKYPSSSTDRSLTESGVQRRLLRVRTWPRIITSLHFVVITVGFFVVAPDVLSRVDDMSWLYAILRKSLRASRWVLWATLISNIYESYDIFNDLRSKYPQPHQNAALNFTTTVPVPQNSSPDDFLKLFALFMFSTVHHLITVLSIWQVIRDLEKRDKRVAEAMAKTKVDSAVASGDDQPDTSCSKDSSLEPSVVMEMPVAEPA